MVKNSSLTLKLPSSAENVENNSTESFYSTSDEETSIQKHNNNKNQGNMTPQKGINHITNYLREG
jgi:hypothetical protein